MADNGSGLSDFGHSLIARVVVYYVALAAVIFGVWAILPAGGRAEVMAALSSLVAFRANGRNDPSSFVLGAGDARVRIDADPLNRVSVTAAP